MERETQASKVLFKLITTCTGQGVDLSMQVVLATIYSLTENFTTIFKRKFENVVDNMFFNFGPLNIDLLL